MFFLYSLLLEAIFKNCYSVLLLKKLLYWFKCSWNVKLVLSPLKPWYVNEGFRENISNCKTTEKLKISSGYYFNLFSLKPKNS